MRYRYIAIAAFSLVYASPLRAEDICTAIADAATGEILVQRGDCSSRVTPASTFKIAISLMGYDAGFLKDEHQPKLPFREGYVDWRANWRTATDPTKWMADSVVWYSQQVTGALGKKRFAAYTKRFDYGNADVSGDVENDGLTMSWIGSSLKISPLEQLAFLRKVINRQLGVSQQAYDMTAELTRFGKLPGDWIVNGKYGAAQGYGWYVGWAAQGGRTVVFARLMRKEKTQPPEVPAGVLARDAFIGEFPQLISANPLTHKATDEPLTIRALVDAAIHPLMAENDVPGMAIAVIVDGRAFFFNYGVASKETKQPVDEATIFELGSVSKTLTATLASYAQVVGRLSLDDHPSKYLPQLKGYPIDQARLVNLGTYTAGGLPLQFPDAVSDASMVRYFQQWQPAAPPGTQRQYSTPSAGLFGYIAGLALRRDFADAMENKLFRELGFQSSYVHVPPGAMVNYAWGYDETNHPVRVNPGVLDEETYGVKSNSADMSRFLQANMTPARLGAAMRGAVQGTQVGYFKSAAMVQGLGWEQYAYPVTLGTLLEGNSAEMILDANPVKPMTPPHLPAGLTLFDKTGSTGGFGTYLAFIPGKNLGIVMLANKNYPIPARIKAAHAILTAIDVIHPTSP